MPWLNDRCLYPNQLIGPVDLGIPSSIA